MREATDSGLPNALRKTLDRLDRQTLAAVSRYAATRLGAMGGVEGGKKRWAGTTKRQRSEAARKAVLARWARVRAAAGKHVGRPRKKR
jgi:hypothetical protein